MAEGNQDNLFLPFAVKWQTSRTVMMMIYISDDDDYICF